MRNVALRVVSLHNPGGDLRADKPVQRCGPGSHALGSPLGHCGEPVAFARLVKHVLHTVLLQALWQ